MNKVEKYLSVNHNDLWGQLYIKDLIPQAITAIEEYAELYHQEKVKKLHLHSVSKCGGIEREPAVCCKKCGQTLKQVYICVSCKNAEMQRKL